MKLDEFKKGLNRVSTALRGSFEKSFADYLWAANGNLEDGVWEKACYMVARSPKQARFIVARDFQDAVIYARNELHAGKKHQDARTYRRSMEGEPIELKRMLQLQIDKGSGRFRQDAIKRMRKLEKDAPDGKEDK